MITTILNSGFGHSTRFIAMMETLKNYTDDSVNCLVPESTRKFVSNNITYPNCNVYNLYQIQLLFKDSVNKNKFTLKPTSHDTPIKPIKKNRSGIHINSNCQDYKTYFEKTTLIVNDFFPNMDLYKTIFTNNSIKCCLYHGDIISHESDNNRMKMFKEMVCQTANSHDVFFHINITPPQAIPNLSCEYISIPTISRSITVPPALIKMELGLKENERFILVHCGSAVMENVYAELNNFYNSVNYLKTDYRLVIAKGLDNNGFAFNSNIIRAPLYNNGINLINAADMVISKPGMGILQDCIAAKKPLIFIPGDFPERNLKIQLLDSLLDGMLPKINAIHTPTIEFAIKQCEEMKDVYFSAFSKVATNGADLLAQAVSILARTPRAALHDTCSYIRGLNAAL